MQPGWVRWIAYALLAALVIVTSCQAMAGPVPQPVLEPAAASAGAAMYVSFAAMAGL
jgi:hypothetical protein